MNSEITEKGVTVWYVRTNEVHDVFGVLGNGFDDYLYYPRSSCMTCEEIIVLYVNF